MTISDTFLFLFFVNGVSTSEVRHRPWPSFRAVVRDGASGNKVYGAESDTEGGMAIGMELSQSSCVVGSMLEEICEIFTCEIRRFPFLASCKSWHKLLDAILK